MTIETELKFGFEGYAPIEEGKFSDSERAPYRIELDLLAYIFAF
jgi:hypothetical protein